MRLSMAAKLFPLDRDLRRGPAYALMMFGKDVPVGVTQSAIIPALRSDPFAPDLLLGLTIAKFHDGDISGAQSVFAQLEKVSPKSATIIQIRKALGQ